MGQFNTLAQSRTKNPIIICGKGSAIDDVEVLNGRTKRKIITQKLMLTLIDLAKDLGDTEAAKSYWNTYNCQSRIYTADGRLFGKYCKNRFCTICQSIRKAEKINKYYPVLKTWPDPQFTTLTIKAVPATKLKVWLPALLRAFQIINSRLSKRRQRGERIKVYGIKSLECNFNPAKKRYNPHLHLILPNREVAEAITKEWLQVWKGHAGKLGQFTTPVTDLESSLIEIIKYGSKIISEPNSRKGIHKAEIFVAALHNIYQAMKDHRVFDRFGFNLPPVTIEATSKTINFLEKYDSWIFKSKIGNWTDIETGELLSDHSLPAEIHEILSRLNSTAC